MSAWSEILSDITDRLPPPEDPRTFSFFIAHLSHVYARYMKLRDNEFYKHYRKALAQYTALRFPTGMALLARGMDNLRPSANLVERIAEGDRRACAGEWLGGDKNPINVLEGIRNGKCTRSWSENVVISSAHFALNVGGGTTRLDPRVRRKPISLGSVCMIGLMPSSRIVEMGGDSESGELDEAEVFVESPVPAPYLRTYFVTDNPAYKRIGKAVTRAEQRYYGLSGHLAAKIYLDDMWPPAYVVLLHPDTDLTLFGNRLRGAIYKPTRDDWRRVG